MLQNAYFLAKIGADTAENEQHFAEILPKIGNYPTGPSRTARELRGKLRVLVHYHVFALRLDDDRVPEDCCEGRCFFLGFFKEQN